MTMTTSSTATATATAEKLIDVQAVSRVFPKANGEDLLVLENVDLTIRSGEIVGLLGRSGSGKSTLLRIIAGLSSPSTGVALYRGKPISGPPRGLAMVFQSFALFPWLTVLQNVELGLEALGIDADERRRRALEAIDLIGLDGFESAYPKELSGGMRQRVGFARALVVHPDIMLMDEPFSALDVLTAETLRTDIIDLWVEGRLPMQSVLIVTHNIEEAVLMCDRILVFSSNPGRIASEMKVDLPHPRNRLDPTFRKLVDSIYAHMTRREEPKTTAGAGIPGTGVGMVLNPVSTNEMAGLLEALAAEPFHGRADLPVLADRLQMEADELFHLAETLQLLRLANLSEGDLLLTEPGKTFTGLGTDDRKKLFAQHLLSYVPIVGLIRSVLDERPTHTAPSVRFRQQLEDYMSEDYADETLKAVVAWARYAELFAFDENADMFSLENPE
ncbi:AAA-associated domain-containing protein [Pleomorphomonas sp. PLEO]|uniref:ABC transporter ATP-binding protein n=1 Tax=Pleomorphomonas sp. PLEO TaxID=3239306 RepID=UPI00351E5966